MFKYYPVSLALENKKCLVVGAGKVALRKVKRLLECGAKILVISPEVDLSLKALAKEKKIILKRRKFNLKDLNGAYLAIASTDDHGLNSTISSYCRKKNILINVVDCPGKCNFILPSVFRRGNLTISASTDGISPALAKKIRQGLKQRYGPEYSKLLRVLKEIRPQALAKIKNTELRKEFFQKALQPGILNLLKKNKEKEAKRRILSCLK